jgi:hypothetical protein
MKLTFTILTVVGLFTASAVAGRSWVYNDHRRSEELQENLKRGKSYPFFPPLPP